MKHMYCVMLLFISLLICTVPVLAEEVQLPELTNIKSFSPPDSAALSFVRNLEQGKLTLRMDKVNQLLDLFNYEMMATKKS